MLVKTQFLVYNTQVRSAIVQSQFIKIVFESSRISQNYDLRSDEASL